jgi:CysZ protein
MTLFKNFALGIDTYGDAHRLILKHNLWKYVFFPGVINLILFILVCILGYYTKDIAVKYIFNFLGLTGEHQGFIKILLGILHFVLNLFIYFLVFIIYFSTYKYIVLMIMPPILAVLSEKTEELVSGKKYKFNFHQLIKDIFRGLVIAFRNLFIELGFIIILFILGFIPVVGFICPLIVFVISMYYYGFSMIDYSNERSRLTISESVTFVRKNNGFAIANGFIFYVLLMIPLLGLLIAPSYAVVAATIGVEKIKLKDVQGIKK